jgi:hypothetical protein
MAAFQFGRALLCALLTLSLAACPGPDDQPDGGCPLTGCVTDGGTDGGIGPEDPSVITLHAPAGVSNVGFYTVPFQQDPVIIPGCEAADACPYTLPLGGIHEFTVRHHGYHMVSKKTESLRKFGHMYDLDWDGPGECGVIIGDPNLGEGHWPYRDENRPEWDKVYFKTEIYQGKVYLNNLFGNGASIVLGSDFFVVVTGLTCEGVSGNQNDGQEFTCNISSDRETITYRLVNHLPGGETNEKTGTFRRYRP